MRWRWWPQRELSTIEDFAVARRPLLFLLGIAAVLGIFALPAVRSTTGISLLNALTTWQIFAGWFLFACKCLYPRALERPAAFYALVFGNMVSAAVFALSLPVMMGEPNSPLWVAFVLMAAVVGSSESQTSLAFALFHLLAPLATVPFFLAEGHSIPQAFTGPLITSFAAAYGYMFLAQRRDRWRQTRHEREIAEAALRLRDSERERMQLSRDLHDTVGTTLSLVALYGALAESESSDPLQARQLAGTIRAVARDALDELRSVILAIPQGPARLDDLTTALGMMVRRSAEPAGAKVEIRVEEGGAAIVGGTLRTTVVRVFQEAVHNALRHGKASSIQATFCVTGEQLSLRIADDGAGFDPLEVSGGSGIQGMFERVREVGGALVIDTKKGEGTRLLLKLPLPREVTLGHPTKTAVG